MCSSKYVHCVESAVFCCRSLPSCSFDFRKRTIALITLKNQKLLRIALEVWVLSKCVQFDITQTTNLVLGFHDSQVLSSTDNSCVCCQKSEIYSSPPLHVPDTSIMQLLVGVFQCTYLISYYS